MTDSNEVLIEERSIAGAEPEAPRFTESSSWAAGTTPPRDLLGILHRAQAAFSESLDRYIEL
jgi:hypothetical protein